MCKGHPWPGLPRAGSWSEGVIHLYFLSSICGRKTLLFPFSFLSHLGSLHSLTHKMGTNNLLHSSEASYQLRFERLVFSRCLLILLFVFSQKPLYQVTCLKEDGGSGDILMSTAKTVLSSGCTGHPRKAQENLMTTGYFMKTALELLQVTGFVTRVRE